MVEDAIAKAVKAAVTDPQRRRRLRLTLLWETEG